MAAKGMADTTFGVGGPVRLDLGTTSVHPSSCSRQVASWSSPVSVRTSTAAIGPGFSRDSTKTVASTRHSVRAAPPSSIFSDDDGLLETVTAFMQQPDEKLVVAGTRSTPSGSVVTVV